MKKKWMFNLNRESYALSRFIRIMKLTTFLLLFTFINVTASVYSQVTKLDLKVQNRTVKDILVQIEDQSDFFFMYNDRKIDVTRTVNLDIKEAKIEDILGKIFEGTSAKFIVKNRQIVLYNENIEEIDSFNSVETFQQQQKSVFGKVTDSSGSPLPGVSVVVKGTTKGTVTDANGNYSLSNVSKNNTVQFSFIGMKAQEVIVGEKTTMNVSLIEIAIGIEEVVAIGYGTQKRSDITGSVTSVGKNRLQDLPNTNFAQALEGSLAGVSVTTNSAGAESDDISILIHGQKSIIASTKPLLVVDGVPYNGSITDINTNDISSIDILKDASAAAIYGSRGSNGVILITTKKGLKGKPVLTYQAVYGKQYITRLPNLLTPEEFYEFKNIREPGAMTVDEQKIYDSKTFPDWVNLATQSGTRMEHTLGISGGGESSNYYASASYLDVTGVAVNDKFKRLSTRVNLEIKVATGLTYGTNTQLVLNIRDGLPAAFSNSNGAYRFNPLTTAFNPDGSLSIYPNPADIYFGNPLEPTLAKNDDKSYKLLTNNYIHKDLPFVKGLSYRLNTGIEYSNTNVKTYYGRDTKTGYESQGEFSSSSGIDKNILIENILNFNRSFDKHSVSFTGLISYQNTSRETDKLKASGFSNDILTYYQSNIALAVSPSASFSKTILLSQMARINYVYNDKYLLTLTGRRDGFSGFGKDKKYGFFPSVAVGWNIGNEPFLINNDVITSLKLRTSYGSNGNQAVDPYQTLARLTNRSYVDGSTTKPGYIPTNIENRTLGWETSNSLNAGIDFELWNGRLQGGVDAYTIKTHDLLLNRLVPSTQGVTSILQNIGETGNKGIELSLRNINLTKDDFSWSSEVNISINRNQILELYGNAKSDTANMWFIGEPINVNFGYEFGGVFQLDDDIPNSAQPTAKPGYAKIIDQNKDGKIDGRDRTIIGSREPDFIMGFGNTFTYKNFSLYIFMHGIQGTNRINTLLKDDVGGGVRYNVMKKNWWTPTNPTNEFYANNPLANSALNVPLYENNSFIRVKDVTLSYNFSSTILDRLKLTKLKAYVNARNLLTLTKWTGLDPELSSQTEIPLQTEFTFGLNVSF